MGAVVLDELAEDGYRVPPAKELSACRDSGGERCPRRWTMALTFLDLAFVRALELLCFQRRDTADLAIEIRPSP